MLLRELAVATNDTAILLWALMPPVPLVQAVASMSQGSAFAADCLRAKCEARAGALNFVQVRTSTYIG